MDSIFLPAAMTALFVVLFLAVWIARRRGRTPSASVRARPVLEGSQRQLYRTLAAGLPNHHVLASVPFSRFLALREGGNSGIGSLDGHIADFIVCGEDFRVVAVVEINGREARAERDALLRDAALPLVRWHADSLPDASEVRETIRDLESLNAMSEHVAMEDAPGARSAKGRERQEPRL